MCHGVGIGHADACYYISCYSLRPGEFAVIHIPTFQSVEQAAFYAAKHEPLKRALEDFQNRDEYRRLYGEKCYNLAMQAWEACLKGDEFTMWRRSKELSMALPHHLFDYAKRSEK